MRGFLGLSEDLRRDAFAVAAGRIGLPPAAVEKDFWVCWTLQALFESAGVGQHLAFRGGTSLSKVWNVIERFSEDIDLVVAHDALGVDRAELPAPGTSRTQNTRRSAKLVKACEAWTRRAVLPAISRALQEQPGAGGCSLEIDQANPACLLLTYPSLTSRLEYTGDTVRIELCAKADPYPMESGDVRPFVLEQLTELDPDASTQVTVVSARRTFWEKACLLHAFCQAQGRQIPRRHLSRHAYDLVRLDQAGIATAAIAQAGLLESVVANQVTSFRINGLDYGSIQPGSFQLVPDPGGLDGLEQDYAAMRDAMIYGDAPDFRGLIGRLRRLETRINGREREPW